MQGRKETNEEEEVRKKERMKHTIKEGKKRRA
jgi:hypothetical protein